MTAVVAPPEPRLGLMPELLDKLQALGNHKEIALFLAERGIKGTCHNAGICPIARYLQQETGCIDIAVDEDEVTVWHSQAVYNDRYRIPPAVKDFIAFFDARMHPELIDPELPDNRALAAKMHPSAGKAMTWPAA